jgi:uncharacterized membrane protein YkvA (DUF1232 family)
MPLSVPNLLRRAEHLLRHPEELLRTLGEALRKAYAKRSVLVHIFEEFLLLFRFVKAWVVGDYKDTDRGTILWAILAILYFLSPLDLLPDIFPGGYIDDIYVISFILRRIQVDLDKFRAWEKSKS